MAKARGKAGSKASAARTGKTVVTGGATRSVLKPSKGPRRVSTQVVPSNSRSQMYQPAPSGPAGFRAPL